MDELDEPWGEHEADLVVALNSCARNRALIRLEAGGDIDKLMVGYYFGKCPHPFDEKYPINMWDLVDPL